MKDKVIIFFVGLLIGAIISTGSIYFYTLANSSCNNEGMRMNGGNPPDMPNGEMPQMPNDSSSNN